MHRRVSFIDSRMTFVWRNRDAQRRVCFFYISRYATLNITRSFGWKFFREQRTAKELSESLIVSVYFRWRDSVREKPIAATGRICRGCEGMLTFARRNFPGKLNYRGIVSRIARLRIRAMYWHVPDSPPFSFPPDGFAMEIARRENENSYSVSLLFSTSLRRFFHSHAHGNEELRIRRTKNFQRESHAQAVKNLANPGTRYREITFARSRDLKIEGIKKVVIVESSGGQEIG